MLVYINLFKILFFMNKSIYLLLTGPRCSDPGTKGGTTQIVKDELTNNQLSYQLGQLVHYNCSREGFTPHPSGPLECIFDGNNTKWNSSAPVCIGMVYITKCVLEFLTLSYVCVNMCFVLASTWINCGDISILSCFFVSLMKIILFINSY